MVKHVSVSSKNTQPRLPKHLRLLEPPTPAPAPSLVKQNGNGSSSTSISLPLLPTSNDSTVIRANSSITVTTHAGDVAAVAAELNRVIHRIETGGVLDEDKSAKTGPGEPLKTSTVVLARTSDAQSHRVKANRGKAKKKSIESSSQDDDSSSSDPDATFDDKTGFIVTKSYASSQQRVAHLSQSGPLTLPTVSNKWTSKSHEKYRLQHLAAALQKEWRSAVRHKSLKRFSLQCSYRRPSQSFSTACTYKLVVSRMMINGRQRWRATEESGHVGHELRSTPLIGNLVTKPQKDRDTNYHLLRKERPIRRRRINSSEISSDSNTSSCSSSSSSSDISPPGSSPVGGRSSAPPSAKRHRASINSIASASKSSYTTPTQAPLHSAAAPTSSHSLSSLLSPFVSEIIPVKVAAPLPSPVVVTQQFLAELRLFVEAISPHQAAAFVPLFLDLGITSNAQILSLLCMPDLTFLEDLLVRGNDQQAGMPRELAMEWKSNLLAAMSE